MGKYLAFGFVAIGLLILLNGAAAGYLRVALQRLQFFAKLLFPPSVKHVSQSAYRPDPLLLHPPVRQTARKNSLIESIDKSSTVEVLR